MLARGRALEGRCGGLTGACQAGGKEMGGRLGEVGRLVGIRESRCSSINSRAGVAMALDCVVSCCCMLSMSTQSSWTWNTNSDSTTMYIGVNQLTGDGIDVTVSIEKIPEAAGVALTVSCWYCLSLISCSSWTCPRSTSSGPGPSPPSSEFRPELAVSGAPACISFVMSSSIAPDSLESDSSGLLIAFCASIERHSVAPHRQK